MYEFVPKSWGFEKIITNTEKYCLKELYIAQGRRLSMHYHKLKDETFYVISGKIELIYYKDTPEMEFEPFPYGFYEDKLFDSWNSIYENSVAKIIMNKGDNIHIEPQKRHSLYALKDSRIIEASTQHFDSDSYRILKGD